MLVYASKGRREMPDGHVYLDGPPEQLGRDGQFFGRHICTPLQGVAVHINAFNFPVWGMLEKLAPTLLAGMPAIVKPATATCYVTEACVRMMLESGILPEGALATGDRRHRRYAGPPRLPGRGDLHRVGRHRAEAAGQPEHPAQFGAVHGRAGQPERLSPGAGCHARHARVRSLREGSAARDDREGGAEMHRHPADHGARSPGGGRDRRR